MFIHGGCIGNIRIIDGQLWCCTPDKIEVRNEDFRMEKNIITKVGEIVDVAERDADHVYVATKQHGIHVFTKLGKSYNYNH